ncbi:MAG: hypothetical protein J3Q66DRAFT_386313 [Benniella sp.]|nr:MAG: hypothetical protein J3Q66DRAFT_386313 [Benniella sp.]
MNDRNTDLDAAYHELVHTNELQKNSRVSKSDPLRSQDYKHQSYIQPRQHHNHRLQAMQPCPNSADQNPPLGIRQLEPPQHAYQQPNQRRMQRQDAGADVGAFEHRYRDNSYIEKNHLQAAYPPLHDNFDNPSNLGQDPQIPSRIMSRMTKQPGLLPPPIQIPKLIQQPIDLVKDNRSALQNQQLPSPAHSASSPESPSSLAIHLYVHHHHHHHSQHELSFTGHDGSGSNVPTTPLVLLSPLTLPPAPALELLEPKVNGIVPSLPSPPLLVDHNNNSESAVSLLPSPPIPCSGVDKDIEKDASSTELPWFTHPNSLANSCAPPSLPTQPQSRRRRQIHRPQLPDPVLATQLLSTISPSDLARLYVHAAHHLHSHQPIRRYVLMKMIMTQAKLSQYGRLRAEMPRAPGPSTGAQPKRTARPKVPLKLGMYMTTTASASSTVPDFMVQQQQRLQKRRRSRMSSSSSPAERVEFLEASLVQEQKKGFSAMLKAVGSALSWTSTWYNGSSGRSDSCPNAYSGKLLRDLESGERSPCQHAFSRSKTTVRESLSWTKYQSYQESENDGDVKTEGEDPYDDDGDDEDDDTQNVGQHLLLYPNAQFQQPSYQLIHLSFSSSTSSSRGSTSDKSKNARRRKGVSSCLRSTPPFPSDTIRPSTMNTPSSSVIPESYGTSGLLMLSLLIFFLFLLEGSNLTHSLQSALLSIIL